MKTKYLPMVVVMCLCVPALGAISTTGLVDYFDADTGITTDGTGAVTGWDNQVAASYDVSVGDPQSTIVSGPNGQTMIHFVNASNGAGLQYQNSLVAGDATLGGYTIFAAVSLTGAISSTYPRFVRTVDDQDAIFIRKATNGTQLAGYVFGKVSGTPWVEGSYNRPGALYPTDLAVHILTLHTRTIGGSTVQELYIDGTLASSSTYAVDYSTITPADMWEIGNSINGTNGGDIGSVLIYDYTAPLVDLNATGAQLAADYGLTWGNEVPEPATLMLLGLGGLTCLRRRK